MNYFFAVKDRRQGEFNEKRFHNELTFFTAKARKQDEFAKKRFQNELFFRSEGQITKRIFENNTYLKLEK